MDDDEEIEFIGNPNPGTVLGELSAAVDAVTHHEPIRFTSEDFEHRRWPYFRDPLIQPVAHPIGHIFYADFVAAKKCATCGGTKQVRVELLYSVVNEPCPDCCDG